MSQRPNFNESLGVLFFQILNEKALLDIQKGFELFFLKEQIPCLRFASPGIILNTIIPVGEPESIQPINKLLTWRHTWPHLNFTRQSA